MEWLNFKEVYELTTELGEYSECDNIARFFEACKGDARDLVGTLLATSRDPKALMNTLKLHYGKKDLLAENIEVDLKSLPHFDSRKISLTQFATKLKNAVLTFKAHDLIDFLYIARN